MESAKKISDKQKKSLEMDRYKNGTTYAITIAPDDHRQYFGKDHNERLSQVQRYVTEYLKARLKYIEDVQLCTDISYPQTIGNGKLPRVHYHGTISFKNLPRFLLSHSGSEHLMIDIDTIDDPKYWKQYCRKFIKLFTNYELYNIETKHVVALQG